MSANETPRMQALWASNKWKNLEGDWDFRCALVEDHARQLERELNEAKEYIKATEYWQLSPMDSKERTAYFNKARAILKS